MVATLANPQTKKEIRRMLGFFNFFHAYIPHLAELTARFTAKLTKGQPNVIEWTEDDSTCFEQIKKALCEAAERNLYTAKWGQPFGVYCDSSNIAVGSCLVQWTVEGQEVPISFASAKLVGSQVSWAAIEKEAYAVIWSLNKFRTWIFGSRVTVFSDSNPLTYLISSVPKSEECQVNALGVGVAAV